MHALERTAGKEADVEDIGVGGVVVDTRIDGLEVKAGSEPVGAEALGDGQIGGQGGARPRDAIRPRCEWIAMVMAPSVATR